LARIWRDHGKRPHAHDLLARILGRFTEGFDTLETATAELMRMIVDSPIIRRAISTSASSWRACEESDDLRIEGSALDEHESRQSRLLGRDGEMNII
jgi:hypothetical protein